MSLIHTRSGLVLVCTLMLAAACGGVPAANHPKPAAPTKPAANAGAAASVPARPKTAVKRVTLQLPWLTGSYDTGFIVAKEMGYYRKAGFQVAINQGKGTPVTAELVAKGADPFGVVDAGATTLLISKGLPVKMVAVYIQKSTNAFVYDTRHPFTTPKGLVGRRIVGNPAAASIQLLPAVLQRYGVSMSQLHFNMLPPSSRAQVLVSHPDAILADQADDAGATAMIADKPYGAYKLYANFGVNLYADGLVVTKAMISKHPSEIKRFIAASNQGWMYTLQHRSQAIKMVKKLFPHVNLSVLSTGLKIDLGSLHTPATKGHPLGWMATSDWSGMVSLLHRYGRLKKPLPASSYYTDRFIPAS